MTDHLWLGDLALDATLQAIAGQGGFAMVSLRLSDDARGALVPACWRLMEGDPAMAAVAAAEGPG